MGFDSIWHWIAALVIVLLLFGTKKIRNIGPDIGNAVRGFKEAMRNDNSKETGAKETGEKLQADPPPEVAPSSDKHDQHSSSKSQ